MNKRIITVFAIILVFCFISCSTDSNLNLHNTNVIRQLQIQEYGPYVFISRGKVWKYNILTNELTKACVDPECKGDCPLEGAITYINQVWEGKLFFSSFTAYTHEYYYGFQDLISGEVTILKKLEATENSGNAVMAVSKGWVYYCRKKIKDGGKITNPDDFETLICRIHSDSRTEETVLKIDSASLMAVVEDKLIRLRDGKLVSVDVLSNIEVELLDFDERGFTLPGSKISSLGNTLYFCVKSREFFESEYSKASYAKQYLISVNLDTGLVKKINDSPVISFCLTDEAIYYVPMIQRHLYVPDNYVDSPSSVVVFYADSSLHRCNHDGTDDKVVFTNETLDFAEEFTVIDNKLIGELFNYDEEEHRFTPGGFFGTVDLDTKTITRSIGEISR